VSSRLPETASQSRTWPSKLPEAIHFLFGVMATAYTGEPTAIVLNGAPVLPSQMRTVLSAPADSTQPPSLLNVNSWTATPCPVCLLTSPPASAFHQYRAVSNPEETPSFPPLPHVTAMMSCSRPPIVNNALPVAMSVSRTVRSLLTDAMALPSGRNATA